MKLKLPHRDVKLNMELGVEERLEVVNQLLTEQIEFHEQTMSVEEYFDYTFKKDNTKICLDILGYYLSKEKRNLEVMSNDKMKEMKKGSKRHTTFSGMGYADQVAYGLVDPEDYQY